MIFFSISSLISPVHFVCQSVSFSANEFEFDVPQNLSVSRQRSTTAALEREQNKRAKASMEATPVRSLPAPRWGPPKRCLRMSGAGRHQLQKEHHRKTGRRSRDHRLRRLEVEGTPRSDHTCNSARELDRKYQQDELDANHRGLRYPVGEELGLVRQMWHAS